MEISWWKDENSKNLRLSFDLELDSTKKVKLIEWESITLIPNTSNYAFILEQDRRASQGTNSKRRNLPTVTYNCHGLSFANRRGWLNNVATILDEEEYKILDDEEVLLSGDVIAYLKRRGEDFEITHTGIVCADNNSTIKDYLEGNKTNLKIVSKWGALGEHVHNYDQNPYYKPKTLVKFFRYNRTKY